MRSFILDRAAHRIRHTQPTPLAVRLAAALRDGWHRFLARRRRKATIWTLQALDDRTLSDIGLDRSEIASVVEQRSGPPERRQRVVGVHFFRHG